MKHRGLNLRRLAEQSGSLFQRHDDTYRKERVVIFKVEQFNEVERRKQHVNSECYEELEQ